MRPRILLKADCNVDKELIEKAQINFRKAKIKTHKVSPLRMATMFSSLIYSERIVRRIG